METEAILGFLGIVCMLVLFVVLHRMDFTKYNTDGSKYNRHQASFEIHSSIRHKKTHRVEAIPSTEWDIR